MCGICGAVAYNGLVSRDVLEGMNRQIVHRGPDDEGYFAGGECGMAMRRLSIIDLAGGHQPIGTEDGRFWIVYNGEIYNHLELRRELESRGYHYRTNSDTETILHAYEEYGANCVTRLRGMFAFAIWDRRRRRLFAARDRLGIKPFYYAYENRTFIFASEIKAILAYPGFKPELARSKLSEYLAFGFVSGSYTLYEGIRRLAPAHTLELGESAIPEIRAYWNVAEQPAGAVLPYAARVREFRERLEECVCSHLMSDVPLGVFLSGGLDSSAIAALTAKIRQDPIRTFSVGYDEQAYSELPYARAVAAHVGSDHHEVRIGRKDFFGVLPHLIWQEDEPLAFTSSIALYFVAQLAREHVKVVLTGEGSDETLGGYERYAYTLLNARLDPVYRSIVPNGTRKWLREKLRTSEALGAVVARRLRHTFIGRDGAAWHSLYFDNFFSAFSARDQQQLLTADVLTQTGDPYASALGYWQGYSGDLLHKMLYTDINTYLQELLMRQDQMSMAASIESRVPFLDHALVEFAWGLPRRSLIHGMTGKHVLKEAVADLLPPSIVYRKKMGFPTPWTHWLAGEQLDQLEALLLEPRSVDRGLVRRGAIRLLFEEHRSGFRDRASQIWRLLNLEIWQRVFLDGESAADIRLTPRPSSRGIPASTGASPRNEPRYVAPGPPSPSRSR